MRTAFSEATTSVDMPLAANSRQESGSPTSDLMSAVTLSAPCPPPFASNETLTRALGAAFGSGRESLVRCSS